MVTPGVHVIGAGGHALVIVDALISANCPIAGIYDDDPLKWGRSVAGIPIAGGIELIQGKPGTLAVLAIGNNEARMAISQRLHDVTWATVVHRSAYVSPLARLGAGAVVMAGAIVQPNVIIGRQAIVNTAASIDHDCVIEDYAHIGPGAHLAGGVRIGTGSLIGTGTAITPYCRVGEWAVVGAGAAVICDLGPHVCAVGVPAKPRRACNLAASAVGDCV